MNGTVQKSVVTVSKSEAGLCPVLPNETATTKYLRQDGSWAVPPDTTYSTVSKSEAGLCPVLPNETATNKYLRQDGSWATIVDIVYPVGSVFISANQTSPSTLFPGTYWKRLKDQMLMGAGDTYTAGATGGAASVSYTPSGTVGGHALTVSEIPSHTHTFTGDEVTSSIESQGHTHSVGAHAHGLNAHTHSVGAHSHGLNSHTHTGPSHSHTIAHTHPVYSTLTGSDPLAIATNGSAKLSYAVRVLKDTNNVKQAAITAANSAGMASILTGDPSNANSGAGGTGNTGAASGSTANSTAFNSGTATG